MTQHWEGTKAGSPDVSFERTEELVSYSVQ
jgi:hypothetical protein